jgi:hypothetical protein
MRAITFDFNSHQTFCRVDKTKQPELCSVLSEFEGKLRSVGRDLTEAEKRAALEDFEIFEHPDSEDFKAATDFISLETESKE